MTDPGPRRVIFYVHGFDRRGPRYFNLWQKREARAYQARHGMALQIGDLEGDHWRISAPFAESDFHFLDWTDVIKARFGWSFWQDMVSMMSLFAVALRQGIFGQVRRADWMIGVLMIWAFMPILLLCLGLFVAVFWGIIAVIGAATLIIAVLALIHRFDRYFGMFYALRIAWVARRLALRDVPDLEAKIAEFKAKLAECDADEIILVGHSIGAAIAMRLLEASPRKTRFLTIGQSIPLVSFQREASNLREYMRDFDPGRLWVDISAGRDPLGFQGFDPSGGHMQAYSAHFSRSFGEATLKALKWRGVDMHFLYFKAVEVSGASFDWFALLSGATSLDADFKKEKTQNGRAGLL